MKTTLFYFLCTSIILEFASCSPCKHFFTYETKTVNIKGITTKLKKAGVEIGDIGIGEINIKPEYEKVSERLKELDLRQWMICNQMKGLSAKDPERKKLITENVTIFREMFKIATKQDSVASAVDKINIPTTTVTPKTLSKEELKQKKDAGIKSIKSLTDKLLELMKMGEQIGIDNDNLKEQLSVRIELGKSYTELKNINQQIDNSPDNAKWDDSIKRNSNEMEKLKEKIK